MLDPQIGGNFNVLWTPRRWRDVGYRPRLTMSQVVEERAVSGDEIINVLEIYPLHIQGLRPFIVERRLPRLTWDVTLRLIM